tara:strand:- start:369 stop:584 length:216 start_codon:yes stop_codon:yes gene_type:complete
MLGYAKGDVSIRKVIFAWDLQMLDRMDPSDQEMVENVWSGICRLGFPQLSLPVDGKRVYCNKGHLWLASGV